MRTRKSLKTPAYIESDFPRVVDNVIPLSDKFKFKAKNESQKEFYRLITNKDIVIGVGPSGTGKSWVSVARAIEFIQQVGSPFTKIIVCKPAVEADEKIGFIPGTEREKLEPHVSSTMDIFDKILGKSTRLKLEEKGILIVQPIGFLRGKTIDNSIILIEEAQNLTPRQMKTILTRIGENSKMIISGDMDQSDRYKNYKDSGLYDSIKRHHNIEEFGFFEFKNEDIVRNKIISKILKNYEEPVHTTQNKAKDVDETEKTTGILDAVKSFFR